MTIIMGATFLGGAAVAADSLRHNAINLQNAGYSDKTLTLNSRTVAAKAGYGPDADSIWRLLLETGLADVGPAEISNRLREIGADVYAQCLQRAEALGVQDPGIYLIVAGTELDGRPALYWLNFQLQDFGHCNEAGRVIAYASRAESNNNASRHAMQLVRNTQAGLTLQLDTWARNLVTDEHMYAPHAIGFPVNLRIAKPDGVIDLTLPNRGTANRIAEVSIG